MDFGAPEMPVVNISTLDKKIPQNMILCLSPEWKSSGGGAGGVPNNMQQQIIEQMRKEIDPNDLPPGMTVDDMINMALGRMNGGAAQNRPTTPAIDRQNVPSLTTTRRRRTIWQTQHRIAIFKSLTSSILPRRCMRQDFQNQKHKAYSIHRWRLPRRA